MEKLVTELISQLKKTIGNEKAIAAVSGGVDSTTAATLAYKALGDNVIPVMIDTGFLRKGEALKVKEMLKGILPLRILDRSKKFIDILKVYEDAEEKRKKFRELFYEVLKEIVEENDAKYLIQGTIAADWVETKWGIKTQHNVLVQIGINPETRWGFKIVEPLVELYKNEVREVAKYLGLPNSIIYRQPFPGPGLLVRVVGKISEEKLELLREATEIVEKELEHLNPSQYFAVILNSKSDFSEELSRLIEGKKVFVYHAKATGVMGDVRAYGNVAKVYNVERREWRRVAQILAGRNITHTLVPIIERNYGEYSIVIRAVKTEDFMTADILEIDESILRKIGNEILDIDEKIREVLYDVTTKPPATIEFE